MIKLKHTKVSKVSHSQKNAFTVIARENNLSNCTDQHRHQPHHHQALPKCYHSKQTKNIHLQQRQEATCSPKSKSPLHLFKLPFHCLSLHKPFHAQNPTATAQNGVHKCIITHFWI